MAATFNSVTFSLLVKSGGLSQDADVTERHIPGGNSTYVDRAGRKLPRISGTAKLAAFADLTSLRAQLGETGTLVYSEGSFAAVLLRVNRSQSLPSGVQFAEVEFLVTTA